MKHQKKDIDQKQSQAYPSPLEDAKKKKQVAEQREVAGRHKNDGQKDHKGAH